MVQIPKLNLANVQSAYSAYNRYRGGDYKGAISDVASLMVPSTASAARKTAATVLKSTKLKKYLDRTYEKKCGVEVKSYDIAYVNALTTTLTDFQDDPYNLAIPQGTNDESRIGNQIEIKKVLYKISFNADPAATATTRMRLFLVKCGKNAGSVASPNEILYAITNIRSPRTMSDQKVSPFTILKEWNIKISNVDAGNDRYELNYVYTPKGCHLVTYASSDTTGAQTSILEGQLVLYGMYENFGGAFAPGFHSYTRYEFVDV